jgi:Ca-activated chloride channel family protein
MLYNWFQNIEFRNEWVLPFLLALPVIAWFYFSRSDRKSTFSVTTTEVFHTKSLKSRIVQLPFWLRLLALGCLILALARPQVRNVQNRTKGQGIDIVLCMDVSGSMLSADFYPSRLEVSKQMAAEFVRHRPIDQLGLVIFSGESYTQFPLSTDHAGLLEQINGLRSGMLIDGTVIGEGLATSVERLSSSKSKSRIIILLTDGNEQPPDTRLIDPITALEIARTKGVKVYTIGMGARGGEAVQEKGVARSKGDAFLDETLLRRIAGQTGGQYFRATDKESLQEVYAQIDRLEKSDIEVVSKTRFQEEFVVFLLLALFLIALELVIRFTYLRTFP